MPTSSSSSHLNNDDNNKKENHKKDAEDDKKSRRQHNNEWVEATDWDEPINTAVLYKSVESFLGGSGGGGVGCGHAIQWNPNVLVDLKRCPICDEPVTMICDGLVVSSSSSSSSSTATTSVDDNDDEKSNNNNNDIPTICCKFGKQIYRLSVMRNNNNTDDNNDNPNDNTNWLLSGIIGWLPFIGSSLSSQTTITAQDRIKDSLGLIDGYRILHKGKVVYPPPTTTSTFVEQQIVSTKLVQLSKQEWDNSLSSKGKKFMTVMGTQRGKELLPNKNNQEGNGGGGSLLSNIITLPIRILQWSIVGTWWLVVSFLQPFLPERYLPSPSSSTHHDHQD